MIEYTVGVYYDGTKAWYLNGELHREDGPAIEGASGYKAWYLNGERHREEGPAIEWASGSKWWYLRGERLTEAEFNRRMGKVVEVEEVEKARVAYNAACRKYFNLKRWDQKTEEADIVEAGEVKKAAREKYRKLKREYEAKEDVDSFGAAYVDDVLEDVQEAICQAGGRFFREKELLALPLEELLSIFVPNGITVRVKYDKNEVYTRTWTAKSLGILL